MPYIYLLGAPDPEMEMIEALLRRDGVAYAYAAMDGHRVHAGNAYVATGAIKPTGEPVDLTDHRVITVECAVAGVTPAAVIDHHRPGDPGYGQKPEDYLLASSVGQVFADLTVGPHRPIVYHLLADGDRQITVLLDTSWWGDNGPIRPALAVVPRDIVLAAAADHCLAAAYRGECPGACPDALMRWRVATRARQQRRPESAVLADIEAARAALRAAPCVEIAGVSVADFRGSGTVPELPEAAAREGIPFLATLVERGQRKTVLQAAPPAVISAWMAEQTAAGRSPYGDPARGFAGVIEP